ncbi:hypothetical protein B0J11DRAFT_592362 [Dendryphion nanum]|uniref:Uncharacterized protein n=1 Tax=Dendryphion nanum TaxID=256645 RepID=A0A9P9DFM8_9PLEO|nr:hypothetical protein B0J11DRAFT_592362 [Dendryphion nanum]
MNSSHNAPQFDPKPVPNTTISPFPTPPAPRTLKKAISAFLKYWTKPFFAWSIYALTLYIALSAEKADGFLGHVDAVRGTWILTLLAKGGDIAFAFAVEDTCDTIAYRTLAWRRSIEGMVASGKVTPEKAKRRQKLEWFLALTSTTGVEGLGKILWGEGTRGQRRVVGGKIRGLALARLVFIFVLIPGPGMLLVANMDQKTLFFPTRSMEVSAGLAVYDPSLAITFRNAVGPTISGLMSSMLRDRSMIWEMAPISKECRRSRDCRSYLIAGPALTVAPWPFTIEEVNVDGFRLKNTPFSQVEFWEPSQNFTASESRDCTLYGGLNRTESYSFPICMIQQGSAAEPILAAWKVCTGGYTQNGTCLFASSRDQRSWTSWVQFYRRNATLTFSRSTFTIEEIDDVSTHQILQITPGDLFEAFNSVLYRPFQSTNDVRYDLNSDRYTRTQHIGLNLYRGISSDRGAGLTFGHDWLRNLLAMPLYIFQPTITSAGAEIPGVENGTQVAPNLPKENYVQGSYCVASKRAVPAFEFVLSYAVLAGVVLMFITLGKMACSVLSGYVETSDFPLLDFRALTVIINEEPEEIQLSSRLNEKVYEEGKMFEQIKGLKIALRKS